MTNKTTAEILTELVNITDDVQKNRFATTADKSLSKIVGVLAMIVRDQNRRIDELEKVIELNAASIHGHIQ